MTHWRGYGPDNVLLKTTAAGPAHAGAGRGAEQGALTYEPYYGLQAKPFSVSTDPRALYPSPTHAAVLEQLLAAIRRREGLIVLTGDMGTGKTTLCRAALYQLDRKTFTTFVPDPSLSREDLLRMLLVGFGEVSVEELKQGRLKGTARADLWCQLYEFLTSLESVDAFAVLVIDEAQHLAPPLLDEIRALSELEAGRRLLQIVLVGQPEFKTQLTHPDMQQIAQRVTTACELGALTREGVGGYVAHRLSMAGGVRDRVEFSQAALDLVYEASRGVPRLVNRICDRALAHGHADQAVSVGRSHVTKALRDLELMAPAQTKRPAAPSVPTAAPGGLFAKRPTDASTPESGADLRALLDLPVVSRRIAEGAPHQVYTAGPQRTRRLSRALRGMLRSLQLPVLGLLVMLGAGAVAGVVVGARPSQIDLPALPGRPSLSSNISAPASVSAAAEASAMALAPPAPAPASGPQQTWVVQVAAFASKARASALVERLATTGMPAYQAGGPPGTTTPLTFVRVGPYPSAEEADAVRDRLRSTPAYEGAFVRNITAAPQP